MKVRRGLVDGFVGRLGKARKNKKNAKKRKKEGGMASLLKMVYWK